MNYAVFLHPFVVRYLDNLSKSERRKCYRSLKELRTGGHKFLYVIKENEVFVEEGFKREKGY